MKRSLAIILLLLGSLLTAAMVACGGGGDDDDDTETDTPTPRGGEQTEVPTGVVGVNDLAHAVVQIFALDSSGDTVWTGSGTIISKDGMILTNAHVVDERFDEYSSLAVAITDQTDEAPDLQYVAEIRAVDYSLDIAVIELTEDIDGGAVLEDFPFVALGDSDTVEIGDEIRILGYPDIGGKTITFTRGSVSGFTSERSVGNRAWIKTDATIAGGNSGGLAASPDGQIIGIPTIAGSGEDSSSVDCRIIEDTNGDGSLDSFDSCVPVGGFINGLRPINLALDLIDAAQAGEEYVSPYYDENDIEATPTGGFDTAEIFIHNVEFSPGVTDDDQPTDIVALLPSRTERVCGFWDYDGMQDGMAWDAIWYVDGEKNDNGSIIGDTWVGGESGNWWVCFLDEDSGLLDGLYELILSVEGDQKESSTIFVGGDHELVEFEVTNDLPNTVICGLAVSPSRALNWGGDLLGIDNVLEPGQSFTLELANATYDLLAVPCDENEDEIEEREISIEEDQIHSIGG